MPERIDRRGFLKIGVGAAVGASAAASIGCAVETAPSASNETPRDPGPRLPIPLRALGKTGATVTMLGLGGQGALQFGRRDDALAIIERALERGVTYFDTAVVYGPSREYLGEALTGRRQGIFLASKTASRSRDGALRDIDDSLRRLRTDHLDLLQLHNISKASELEEIFGAGGAIEAIEEARGDGRIRFAGLTGHYDPDLLEDGIRRYPFDTVLMPLNVADGYRRPFRKTLLPLAAAKQMGIIAMKCAAVGALLRGAGAITIGDALGWVWSNPVSLAILGCDAVEHVDAAADLAGRHATMSATAMAELEAGIAPLADAAAFFKRSA